MEFVSICHEFYCFCQEAPTPSIAEEFTRRVNEIVNQSSASESVLKSNYLTNTESSAPIICGIQPQSNAISSINNNVVKSDILNINENKNLGPDVAVEPNETPVVSAISDSPVIVPKMPMNIKHLQKSSEPIISQSVLDKNLLSSKQHKQTKSKPMVPQNEEFEKLSEVVTASIGSIAIVNAMPVPASALATVPAPAPSPATPTAPVLTPTSVPAPSPALTPTTARLTPTALTQAPEPAPVPVTISAPVPACIPVTGHGIVGTTIASLVSIANPIQSTPFPQPQRIPKERFKSEEKEKDKIKDKEILQETDFTPVSCKPNGPTTATGEYNFLSVTCMFQSKAWIFCSTQCVILF